MSALLDLAHQLSNARRNRCTLANGAHEPASLDEGFFVQQAVTALCSESVTGWKVAVTTEGETLSAPIFAADVFASGACLPSKGRLDHGIECELAFRLGRALPARQAGYGDLEILDAVDGVMCSLELLQSRLTDAFRSPRPSLVADNLGNGGVVLAGARALWRGLDLADAEASLRIDGQEVVRARGGNPFGDPTHAVLTLVNHLCRRGVDLDAGSVAMTGSYTGVHHLLPGQHVRAEIEGFEPVELFVEREVKGVRNAGR
jgi:2-keto-4-pentenoate hydratase